MLQKTCTNSNNIADNIRAIFIAKKDEQCEDATIKKKMEEIEQALGLLDAAFTYLNIYYPNDIEKKGI